MTTKELFENLLQGKKMKMKYWPKGYYIVLNKNGMLEETKDNGYTFNTAKVNFDIYYWVECKEEPKEILDKEEKEYLEAVLRPFKNKITRIVKSSHNIGKTEYIVAFMDNWESFEFPSFKTDTMYKGMKLGKSYTLKDLGLFDRKIF